MINRETSMDLDMDLKEDIDVFLMESPVTREFWQTIELNREKAIGNGVIDFIRDAVMAALIIGVSDLSSPVEEPTLVGSDALAVLRREYAPGLLSLAEEEQFLAALHAPVEVLDMENSWIPGRSLYPPEPLPEIAGIKES